jgi:hypothetical protein
MTVETIDLSPTLRVRIEYDQDALNPATDFCNVGEIVYLNRSRNVLGYRGVSEDEMDRIAKGVRSGDLIGLPVFAYVHGGATIRAAESNPFHCPWDSGQSGFVYCTKETAIKEFGRKVLTKKAKDDCLKYLKAQVGEFASYLEGECYGYIVERLTLDEDGDVTNAEELESCWGYLGDISYVISEATHAAESHLETEHADHV